MKENEKKKEYNRLGPRIVLVFCSSQKKNNQLYSSGSTFLSLSSQRMRDPLYLKPSENILYIQCIHSVTPVPPLKRGKNTKLPYHPPPTIQNPLRPPSQGDRKQKSSSWTWFRIFLLLLCSLSLRGLGGVVLILSSLRRRASISSPASSHYWDESGIYYTP